MRWLLPAVAAGVMAMLGFWPAQSPHQIAWGDLVSQVLSARSAKVHVTYRFTKAGTTDQFVMTAYAKAPDSMRLETPSGMAAKLFSSAALGDGIQIIKARLLPFSDGGSPPVGSGLRKTPGTFENPCEIEGVAKLKFPQLHNRRLETVP